MKQSVKLSFLCILLIPFMVACLTGLAFAREITDMTGRKVSLPDNITKIYAPSPLGNLLLLAVAPEKVCGLANPLSDFTKRFLNPALHNLPTIGSLNGTAAVLNQEVLLAVKPDFVLIVIANDQGLFSEAWEARTTTVLENLGIPWLFVTAKNLNDYPAVFEYLGDLLDCRERTQPMADYVRTSLADARRVVAQVPPEERPKVYYASGADGLNTSGPNAFRANLLDFAGDLNVYRGSTTNTQGGFFEKISLELLMQLNPDMIFVFDKVFFDNVYANPAWKHIKAVKNQQVYPVPTAPFNWFDRPGSSYMGALGLRYLLNVVYPQEYDIDIVAEAVVFCKVFFDADVPYEEMRQYVRPPVGVVYQ